MTNQRHQNARDDAAAQRGIATGLPPFMDGHILVAFHRGDDISYDMAIQAQDEQEQKLQTMLAEREDGDYPSMDVAVVHAVEQAEGVTSYSGQYVDDGLADLLGEHPEVLHRPVLDLDLNAALIPSATPGHFHLYIDKLIPWEDYSNLLIALEKCGIIEAGYMQASLDRGYSSARLPTKPKVLH